MEVSVLRELLRNLQSWESLYESSDVPEVIPGPDGSEYCLFDIQYKFAADYDFMLRIFKKFEFTSKYLNRTIIKMRLGGATNNSLINIFKGNKEIIKIWKNNNITLPLRFLPIKLYKRLIQFI